MFLESTGTHPVERTVLIPRRPCYSEIIFDRPFNIRKTNSFNAMILYLESLPGGLSEFNVKNLLIWRNIIGTHVTVLKAYFRIIE
jgi:hypothetical protein